MKHVFLALAALVGFSAIVMVLWNLLVPDIFGLATVSFWQALGLLVLARLFFGRIGGKMMGMHGHHNPIHEKWMKMTPEERKEFIHKRHEHFHKHE
ncbi:MAG: hypothetical protein LBQ78_00725 [Tannerellaceae bacterium]|nr:hypothetical protein [Tannerellaceae bacterium]